MLPSHHMYDTQRYAKGFGAELCTQDRHAIHLVTEPAIWITSNALKAPGYHFHTCEELDHDRREALRDSWLNDLDPKNFERITIAPFSVERFGATFGLVLEAPSEDRDTWIATIEPGNFMAFFPPWDSGMYDT